MADGAFERVQHVPVRRGGDATDRGARDDEAELMDRIGRVGHQDGVAGAGDGGGQIGQTFLGAERCDHFRFGVQRHVEAAAVISGERPAQAGDAFAGGIAVGARVLHGFDQLGDDMRRGGAVRIAHAQVDDVLALGAGAGLGRVDLGEDVGWQAADAVEFVGHGDFLVCRFMEGGRKAPRAAGPLFTRLGQSPGLL
jgi:hypothetical protein